MIHLLVLAVAALQLQDPAGDAVGDGTLAPPTAPVYANTADFDLQSVTLTSDPKLTVRVQLGSLSNAGMLPNGFSNPIIEVYLDTAPGGAQELLPGSSMAMPPKHGWEIALRATGDEAYAVEAQSQGSPASWPRLPVTVEVQGNAVTLHTGIPRPPRADLYALTGVYDPFTKDGWRPLTSGVSPWAFSSASQQVPVVDLLASSQRAQLREIDSGVLSPYRSPLYGVGWLVLMVLGLITAAAGLVLRRRVRAPERPRTGRAATTDADAAALDPPSLGSDDPSRGVDASVPKEIHGRFLDDEEEAALWPDAEESVDRAMAGSTETAMENASETTSATATEASTDSVRADDAPVVHADEAAQGPGAEATSSAGAQRAASQETPASASGDLARDAAVGGSDVAATEEAMSARRDAPSEVPKDASDNAPEGGTDRAQKDRAQKDDAREDHAQEDGSVQDGKTAPDERRE